jgi:hypothetical protein
MDKKTEGVEILVKDVLATVPESDRDENIILKVFKIIEDTPELLRRYNSLSNDLSDDLSDWIINQWVGKYVSIETGMKSLREVPVNGRCSLIKDYSQLGR